MVVSLVHNQRRHLDATEIDLDADADQTSKSQALTDKLTEKFPSRTNLRANADSREVAQLRKDVELLKEMVRSEKLRNSEMKV